ncbi:MAG: ABC transporter ATP-binding protein, partial [Novosphingobium sp.]|nr:ABC transporter ATP-binding protein [Novosphingobium sp.]
LDEPLGALDLKLREHMQDELKALQRTLGITFVFVTHDQGEALSMADRVAVFNHGRIVQIGSPEEIYQRPRTRFVADFVGSSNILPPDYTKAFGGGATWASLRPEAMRIVAPDCAAMTGKVTGLRYLGAGTRVTVETGVVPPFDERGAPLHELAPPLVVQVPAGQPVPVEGERVGLACAPSDLHAMAER